MVIVAFFSVFRASKTFQESPKIGPKTAQDGPKRAQKAPKTPQEGPKRTPNSAFRNQNYRFSSGLGKILAFSPFSTLTSQ